MNSRVCFLILRVVAIFAILFGAPLESYARPVSVQVQVGASEPLKAVGMVLSPGKLVRIRSAELGPAKDGHVLVSFEVKDSDLSGDDAFITAQVVSKPRDTNGASPGAKGIVSFFGNILSPEGFFNLERRCPDSVAVSSKLKFPGSYLASLIEVRSAQREVLKQRLRVRLTKSKAKQLARLERVFGLRQHNGEPPQFEDNVYDLEMRLFRLRNAVKNSVVNQLNYYK